MSRPLILRAANGHLMEYAYDILANGEVKVQQWNAAHSERCDCSGWED